MTSGTALTYALMAIVELRPWMANRLTRAFFDSCIAHLAAARIDASGGDGFCSGPSNCSVDDDEIPDRQRKCCHTPAT
ncbi:hypothetical protein WP1_030 [Pseudomonas phage WP1]